MTKTRINWKRVEASVLQFMEEALVFCWYIPNTKVPQEHQYRIIEDSINEQIPGSVHWFSVWTDYSRWLVYWENGNVAPFEKIKELIRKHRREET